MKTPLFCNMAVHVANELSNCKNKTIRTNLPRSKPSQHTFYCDTIERLSENATNVYPDTGITHFTADILKLRK